VLLIPGLISTFALYTEDWFMTCFKCLTPVTFFEGSTFESVVQNI